MRQLFQLVFDGGDNLRMQVAGIEHRDTAGKIEIFPAFHVPHPAVLRAFGEDRVDLADAARDRGRCDAPSLLYCCSSVAPVKGQCTYI